MKKHRFGTPDFLVFFGFSRRNIDDCSVIDLALGHQMNRLSAPFSSLSVGASSLIFKLAPLVLYSKTERRCI